VIRVAVFGAAGRMGSAVCRAVTADPELALVAAVSPDHAGRRLGELLGLRDVDVVVGGGPDVLAQSQTEVAVDFTRPDAVMDDVRWCVDHGVHAVVGTTGIGPKQLAEIQERLERKEGRSNVLIAPNFAIGAVLLQRFAAEAARIYPAAEIIELHHDGKLDAPSGTSLATADRMARARDEVGRQPPAEAGRESLDGVRGGNAQGVRIHSVRLPGLVAHQEIIFGGVGETLTIRHDSTQRESFMAGVLLAVKQVESLPGLTIGIESLLGLSS
jgi:4-hydroxy-tetrahydrodipicolinate reductase